ncbi:MAG: ATP-binding cassette domain-containing protein [Ferruginibacter sp.]|nr:ATP-binding cassette domain-containing protein [Ferruginibacter sp.]
MTLPNHIAVFLSNKANKNVLVQQLLNKNATGQFAVFNSLEGALFSAIAIKQLVEEEEQHDYIEVATSANRHLRTLSGGEQKKALLSYLLAKQPAFIIADNPFDNLDFASQETLLQMFTDIAKHTHIIQLITRAADRLPFITNAVGITDDNIVIDYKTVHGYLLHHQEKLLPFLTGTIPVSDYHYGIINNPLVQFNNVTVQYGDRVIVKDINWQINSGQFWHLVGPNGAGKTTLLSLITGDNLKGYGQNLLLFGKRKGTGESVWSIKQKIGYFTSSITDLFSRYTEVGQMIISGFFDSVGLYTKPSARQVKLANQWLELIGMLPQKKSLFHTLSLGQQRMVLIVRAMVKHPPLLIVDEPTAGLDDANAAIVVALINKIAGESSTAILYVSHRAEAGLAPKFIFELTATGQGSTGKVIIV